MKASELIKKDCGAEGLYQTIKSENERGAYRIIVDGVAFVSTETITELLSNGFKVYKVKDLRGLDAWWVS